MKTNSYKPKLPSSFQRLKPKDFISSSNSAECCEPKLITRSLKKPAHSKSKSYSSITREENPNKRTYLHTEELAPATDREKQTTYRYNSKI